jgi:hypothetical protein
LIQCEGDGSAHVSRRLLLALPMQIELHLAKALQFLSHNLGQELRGSSPHSGHSRLEMFMADADDCFQLPQSRFGALAFLDIRHRPRPLPDRNFRSSHYSVAIRLRGNPHNEHGRGLG